MTTSKATHYRRLAARAGLFCSACTVVLITTVVAIELLGRFRFPSWIDTALEIVGLGAFISGVVCIASSLIGAATNEKTLAEPSASPNGGPATQPGNSGVTEGPPSVS